MTVVRQDDFVHARPVGGAIVAVDAREMARAEVIGTTAMVAPRKESVLAAPAPVTAHAPPVRFTDRVVVVRTAPPPPPVAFRVKQQALDVNQGRPLDPGALDNLRRGAPSPAPSVRLLRGPQGGFRPANAGGAQPAAPQQPQNAPRYRPPQVVEQSNRPPARAPEQPQPRNMDRPAVRAPEQPRKAEAPPAPSQPAEAARPAPKRESRAPQPARAPAKSPKKLEKPPEK